MNLEKILAENMIRFGTKNLGETVQKLKMLVEQQSVNLSSIKLTPEQKQEVDEDEYAKAIFEKILQFFKDNGVIFSIDQTEAAYIHAYQKGGTTKKEALNNPNFSKTIQLMASPNDTNKILTQGIITPTGIDSPNDASAESDYLDIVKFCNNKALSDWFIDGEDSGGIIISVGSTGSAKMVSVTESGRYSVIFYYGTTKTNAAQSKQEIVTTSWTVPQQGRQMEKTLPGSMFATGQITLQDPTELNKAIAELNIVAQDTTSKITGITIQSSASGDRGVNGKSGYPNEADKDANKYPLGKPYRPKSAQESGNAALAFGRAETIKSKLGNIAPITIDALIQNGEDAAQYAKIIVNIEKQEAGQTFTQKDLQNILLKSKSVENLQGTKSVNRFSTQAFN